MSRARIAEARRELVEARERHEINHRELVKLPPDSGGSLWVLVAMLLILLGSVGVALQQRSPAVALPAERLARRDALRAEHDVAKRKLEATAPAAPAVVPDPEEGIDAWAKIGRAACTVKQKDLARTALRKLEFEGSESKRSSSDGQMLPAISRAIRQLDEHCRERGIHVLVP